MSAVLESIDSGEDVSHVDTGATGSTQPADAGQTAVSDAAGASADGQRAAVDGDATGQPVADDKSASGSASAGDANGKLIPLSALHESRETIKALKSQIAAIEAQPKLSAEDAELLRDLKAQKKTAAEPKDPDFLEDPKGYVDANLKKAQDALKRLDEERSQRTQAETQQRELATITQTVAAQEQAFVQTSPDYYDAVNHMRGVRAQQLQIWAPQATPQQIQQAIANEEIAGAAQALRAGLNPAEAAYRYARTMGYTPKQVTPAQTVTDAVKPDKDAVRTLGGGGGAEKTDEGEENGIPEFSAALQERFGVRKRK